MMLGLTTYLTTDIAPVPLLWVLPLAIYLLTFVLVFARRPPIRHALMVRWQAVLLVATALMLFWGGYDILSLLLLLHLISFFVTAMVCHGELSRTRPDAERVTEYFLCISVGGALGGAFNVILAPALFNSILEYPLILVLACALRPLPPVMERPGRATGRITGALLVVSLLLLLGGKAFVFSQGTLHVPPKLLLAPIAVVSCLAALAVFETRKRPATFALGMGLLVASGSLLDSLRRDVLLAERNFYGVRQVRRDHEFHLLGHGTTVHGAQNLNPGHRREMLAYYSMAGPCGDLLRELPRPSVSRRVAVIGLGAGSIVGYGKAGERWTYYEIDPSIERIARDTNYFTFLHDTPANISVVIGDGRLAMANAASASYDLTPLAPTPSRCIC
jgi:hypothetical protein